MTVIVGAVVGSTVYLAGDSFCGDENVSDLCLDPKVEKISNRMGIGVAGDIRTEILVKKTLISLFTAKNRITKKYITSELPLKLHEKLKDSQIFLNGKVEAEYLLAHSGHIYYVDDSLAVWESQRPYVAIGAAKQIATGSLAYAHFSGLLEKDPELALKTVLDICCEHSPWVRPPYTFLKI